MKRFFLLAAVLGGFVLACSSADSSQDPTQDPAAQGAEEDLKRGKRCGPIADGTCPSGYWCDMSSVPAGNVGGTGVCKKEHACILNGIFLCPKGETFDTAVCHCK